MTAKSSWERFPERGAVSRADSQFRAVVCFPNRYRLAMSNLGFLSVHRLLNAQPGWSAERAFWPGPGGGARALESGRPLQDFHLLAVSISFENDYPNLLSLLTAAGLPLESAERRADWPLVLVGGPAVSLNPEPIAPFVDACLLGEAETNLPSFLDWLAETDGPKEKLFEAARQIPGLYAPAGYEEVYDAGRLTGRRLRADVPARIAVPRVRDLAPPLAASHIVSPGAEFADAALIELGRGCAHGCRFCVVGFAMRPPRPVDGRDIIPQAKQLMELSPRLGLVAAAATDTPHLGELISAVEAGGGECTLSSLRADGLTPALVESLGRAGQKTVTLAPEAGSERLRRIINKGLTDEDLYRAVELCAAADILHLRLYFMIGLPFETDEDVKAIVDLVKRLRHRVIRASRARRRLGRITLSVSCFVPKPQTPFQWAAMAEAGDLKRRARLLQRGLAAVGGVEVHLDVVKWARLQALLSRGDRRVAETIRLAHRMAGNWPQAFKAGPLNPDYFITRPRDQGEVLPWDFLDTGVSRDHLWSEFERAAAAKITPPCPPRGCDRCGACPP
ncbi:MAG: radical SAM protein [Proteobacteria bacterium]|nr:radical SAM protein [Pseudomonadota bacterium]MBU1742476.1 radical SAM protein [Pseudomonadota bacterium]